MECFIIWTVLAAIVMTNGENMEDTTAAAFMYNDLEETTLTPVVAQAEEIAAAIIDSIGVNVSENIVQHSYMKYSLAELSGYKYPEYYLKNYPYYLSGFDEDSRPVLVAEVGKYDYRHLVEVGDGHLMDKSTEFGIYDCFRLFKVKSTPENPVSQVVIILDADNFDLRQVTHPPTVAFLLKFTKHYREFLANHLHSAIIINVNYVAQAMINILRPVLGNLMEKIQVYGTNKSKWMPELLRQLPQDQLPSWYGGLPNHKPVKVYP